MSQQPDTIDLADVFRSLQRGWRTIAGYAAFGVIAALLVLFLAPKRYQGESTIVLRSAEPLSALSRFSMLGGILGGDEGGSGGGGAGGVGAALSGIKSPIETELQILKSKAVAQDVIDSLMLQARVRSPHGVPASQLFAAFDMPGSFKRFKLQLARVEGGNYRIRGRGIDTVVAAGTPVSLFGGSFTVREGGVPTSATVQVLDREDALKRFEKRLNVSKAGGDVARVSFRADDSLTAAQVANQTLDTYLARRKTTDRGINQYRAEFLTVQLDSVSRDLVEAERALRRHQEASGVLDAAVFGRVALERGAELRSQLMLVQVEEGAINQLLSQVEKGTLDRRQLIAYPAFLKSSSISELITQLSLLEAERLKLLERRTERDPEVQAITQSIASIEGQFMPLAQSYSMSLSKQRTDLDSQLDSLRAELGVLPGAAESGNRLQRDVIRLSTIYGGLQAQLVEAKLAAIGEGGNVRQLDVAMPPKKPVFPRPLPTLAAGGSAGLFFGVIAALALSVFGRYARDPAEIERTTGIPTLRLDRRAPLIVTNGASRTVLVVPLHAQADTLGVAKQIVETSLSRATTATLLDLGSAVPVRSTDRLALPERAAGAASLDVNATIERLAGEFTTVVVRLPELTSDATLAALHTHRPVVFVVPAGRVEREQLTAAMQTLRRLDVPCAGIVVSAAPMGAELPRSTNALVT